MAEMRWSHEGACMIRKRTSKPQAKRPRGTTPSMKVHHWPRRTWKAQRTKRCQIRLKRDTRPKRPAHSDAKRGGYAMKHRTAKAALPQHPQAGSAALQAKSAIRLAAITVNQKAGLRRFAISRLFCISSKLERTRRSAQPPRPRARRRWRPTASRQWREASLPQIPLSGRACPRQPARASR